MKYKPLTEITDEEIEQLWKDIFKVNKITFIERNTEENEIEVKFETTWGDGTEEEPYEEIEDTVIMYPDTFDEPEFWIPDMLEKHFIYRQYMIAKGYSYYWKDNPYVND